LRESLERERERADRLEAELATLREVRKPSLETLDTHETASEATEGTDAPPDRGRPETGIQQASPRSRSWWRRWFGFDER
jgi:hypothetical protein